MFGCLEMPQFRTLKAPPACPCRRALPPWAHTLHGQLGAGIDGAMLVFRHALVHARVLQAQLGEAQVPSQHLNAGLCPREQGRGMRTAGGPGGGLGAVETLGCHSPVEGAHSPSPISGPPGIPGLRFPRPLPISTLKPEGRGDLLRTTQ